MNKTWKAFMQGKHGHKVEDAYKDGEGYYDVMLKGYCDDGCQGLHAIIDRDINYVMKQIRNATVCTCQRCKPK